MYTRSTYSFCPRALTTLWSAMFLVGAAARLMAGDPAPQVATLRIPNAGVQPQAAIDAQGTLHLIYLTGPADKADIQYVASTDGGENLTEPIRVNSQPGSAIAIGTVRGAHLAIGKSGRAHVAWMGSSAAEPKGPDKTTPMLYARQNDDGAGFEPQRNLIQSQPGLDGGGSIAADGAGRVFVAWHAPEKPQAGETTRCVWVAASTDEGRTFAAETAASSQADGACGCCGMRLFATGGGPLWIAFRSAAENVNRDMQLVRFEPASGAFRAAVADPMK